MKCLIPVKRVIDFNVKVRVKSDGTGVETDQVKMSMNPFDEVALEEAVRLKEKVIVKEIIAISIGVSSAQETCRVALARGADRAILIETNVETNEMPPLSIAKILKYFVLQEKPDLVILGKQAIDDDCNQTGQMLAALLGWAQGTNASGLNVNASTGSVEVIREVDGGLETLSLKLPAVVSVDLRLNEPRYISLPNIMKAKSKPLQIIPMGDLKIELKQHLKTIQVEPPVMRRSGIKVNNAKELVDKLRNEAKVL